MRTLVGAVVLITAIAAAMKSPAAAPPAPDNDPSGVWRYRIEANPILNGTLRLTLKDQTWEAQLRGSLARGRASADGELRITFPEDGGELRAHVNTNGGDINGFWLQPARSAAGPPQAYATPVDLRPTGCCAWHGEVRPLPRSFTLYAVIFRNTDGELTAAFRNPEFNANAGRGQFLVSVKGDAVTFSSRPAQGRRPVVLTGSMTGGRLRVLYPPLPNPIDFVRATRAQAVAFYPRPRGARPLLHRQPAQLQDGWLTANPAAAGLDEDALDRLATGLATADPAATQPTLIHSLLIARQGKLVFEEYFFGFDRETLHDTRSAAKTFNAVMLGAVMMSDPGFGPQSRIYQVMARLGPFANSDSRKDQITLAHLMTHTSGLDCDDNDDESPGAEETMQSQTAQPDWWKYTLDLRMVHDPGARYAYCSANTNLVAGALSVRSATWLPELFDRTVARPLQFGAYAWDLAPNGEGYGGGGVYVRPRDLLKIGQAYLDGGVWNGRRIASADWVTLSTTPKIEVSPETTGLSADAFADAYIPARDGYAWHLNQLRAGDRVYRDYEATGNGGQLLIVVPDLGLAVVITAGNYGQGIIWNRWRDSIVAQQIIPAIRRRE